MESTITSIFSSDNPFKFFFLCGLGLLILGLYYPFEKRQKLDLQKNQVELSDSTLLIELDMLKNEVESLVGVYNQTITELDSLSSVKINNPNYSKEISQIINELKIQSNLKYEEVKKKRYELELKRAQADFKTKEIKIYEAHLQEIRNYSWTFIAIGLVLAFYGGIRWYIHFKTRNGRN